MALAEVQALFDAGEKRPAVIRSMSGEVGTGPLHRPQHAILAELTDPSVEVYFLDELAGASTVVKTTWDELIDSERFFASTAPRNEERPVASE